MVKMYCKNKATELYKTGITKITLSYTNNKINNSVIAYYFK